MVGFGYNTQVFVEENGIVRSNWPFTFKYFPWSMARPMMPVQFKAKKPEGTLRIFVLGGSAAQGFPDEEFGIAGQLQVLLEKAYPARKIEVLNAAITAVNSHVVLPVAQACLEYDPDYLIVYLGNNEVVGPHGAGTVFSGFSEYLPAIRLGTKLKSTRLYQLIFMLSGKHQSPSGSWKGMESFLQNTIFQDDPRLSVVYNQFEANLDDLLTAADGKECQVLLSTVGVNLSDNPPFASQEPKHAEREYRSGLDYLEAGKLGEAQRAFENARNWDGLRFRADTSINAIIRELASRHQDGVTLIDSERLLSAEGMAGNEWFFDHVHLSFEGNYQVAKAMAESVIDTVGPVSEDLPSSERVASLLAYSEWDRLQVTQKLTNQLLDKPPFSHQWDHAGKQLERQRVLRKLHEQFTADKRQASRTLIQTALDSKPEDPELNCRYGRLLEEMGDVEAARELIRKVVQNAPTNHEALLELSKLSASLGDFVEAEASLLSILDINPYAIEVRNAYSNLLFEAGRLNEAASYNEGLVNDHPKDPDIRYVMALILKAQGKQQEALEQLELAVAIDPDHSEARALMIQGFRSGGELNKAIQATWVWVKEDPLNSEAQSLLAELLSQKKDFTGAIDHYKRAIELNPDFVVARSRFVQSMAQQGRIHEAIQFLGTQLKDDPEILEGHSMLGVSLDLAGRKEQAIAILSVGLNRDPMNLKCRRELAWILATAKSDQLRNGREAVGLAERLVELSPNDPDFRNVLAAAYAEVRQFDKAISSAEEGIRLATSIQNQSQIDVITTCLGAYRRSQPLRTN
jgi:tetratricopeptide (TPR) repeat protein